MLGAGKHDGALTPQLPFSVFQTLLLVCQWKKDWDGRGAEPIHTFEV